MDNVKVSVIIPVYNTEKYLKKCLDSLTCQTLDDIELICINDDSTDDSLKILEEYAKNDKRIKIISKEHGGAGATRNVGLKHATGEYVSFIDSDDWIDLKTYEYLYNEAKLKDTEIIMFKLINYDDDEDYFYEDDYYNIKPLEDFFQKDVFSYEDIKDKIMKIAVSTVNKFYKRSFLSEIGAKFPEGIMFEDNAFFFRCILNSEKISLFDKHLYYRRRHNSSVMSSANEKLFDIFPISNIICDIFFDESVFEFHKEQLVNFKLNLFLGRYKNLDHKYKDEFIKLMVDDFSKFDRYFEPKRDFSSYFNSKNSKLYSNLLEARNSKEFELLNEIIDLKSRNNKLKSRNNKLKSRNNKLKSINKELKSKNKKLEKKVEDIHSTISWRITKPLRIIRNTYK